MTDNEEQPRWTRALMNLSRESLRQMEYLEEALGESRNRIMCRALDMLFYTYTAQTMHNKPAGEK